MNDINGNKEAQEQLSAKGSWNGAGANELMEAQAADEAYTISGSTTNRGMILLLGTCVIGMVLVFLIGRYQDAPEASEEDKLIEAKVDVALARLVENGQSVKLLKDTEKMVQTFYEYPTNQQVLLDELSKNPFSRMDEKLTGVKSVSEQTLAQQKRQLENKLEDLELQSIVQSSRGTQCLVNDAIFSEGQVIGEDFYIKSITVDKVILQAGKHEFILVM